MNALLAFLMASILHSQKTRRYVRTVGTNESQNRIHIMIPRGDKSSYSNKQKRQASHIEKGYERRGLTKKTAKKRAWATVNKRSGGGKKSGSGRRK